MDKLISSYAGKKVLITGAGGYIGTNLTYALLDADCEIIRVSRNGDLPVLVRSGLKNSVSDFVGEYEKQSFWQSILQDVDILFHLSAQTNIYEAAKDPLADFEANVVPVLHMLDAVHSSGGSTGVVFASSATVVGMTENIPVDEHVADHPVTIYDVHKQTAENYLKIHAQNGGGRTCSLRLCNVYGPGRTSLVKGRGVINTMIRRAVKGESLSLYGSGEYIRDYIYIDDVIKAFLMAGRHIDKLSGGHYLIGSGTSVTLKRAFEVIQDEVLSTQEVRVEIKNFDTPATLSPIEFRNFVANHKCFTNKTSWWPDVNFKEGIRRTIDFIIKNEMGS